MIDIQTLQKIHFVKGLPQDVLEEIAGVAQLETFDEEAILIRQDQDQHLIHMLVSGRIFLTCRASGGQSLTLDELTPGQTFGVSSLIENSPSTYTAICAEECEIITLSSAQLLQLFKKDYAIGYTVMQRVVEKFKARMNRHTERFLSSLASHPAISGPPAPTP